MTTTTSDDYIACKQDVLDNGSHRWMNTLRKLNRIQGRTIVHLPYSTSWIFTCGDFSWCMDPYCPPGTSDEDITESAAILGNFNFCVVTHLHRDHFHLPLLKQMETQHSIRWIISASIARQLLEKLPLAADRLVILQPGESTTLSGMTITCYEGLHAEPNHPLVPSSSFLIQTQDKLRLAFPVDIRDYAHPAPPQMQDADYLFAHLWLGRGLAAEQDFPMAQDFCRFFLDFRPKHIFIAHLLEAERPQESMWTWRHARLVKNIFQQMAPSLPVLAPRHGSSIQLRQKTLHILIALYRYVFWGGLQKDTLRLAEEAISRGHQVTIFTTSWDNPPDYLNVEYVSPRGFSNVARMKHYNDNWKKRLLLHDYDVSVAMDRVENANFYFAADSCLKTYYRKKHPQWLLNLLPRYRFILNMERNVCGANSPTITWYISPFQRKEYMEEYGTADSHLKELPPGMNPACVRPDENTAACIRKSMRQELKLAEHDLALVLVGSNAKRKGMDRLVLAASKLPQHIKQHVKILLVGNVLESEIKATAESCGLWAQCLITGPRKDVDKILLACDLMVHPAREEGTGTVLVEGIAAGLPVICTACCGFSPYVQAAAQLVTPEPFQQTDLDALLLKTISNLPDFTKQTRAYAKTQDFTSRQRTMLDYIEDFSELTHKQQNNKEQQ